MLEPSPTTLVPVRPQRGTTITDVRSARRCLGWWFADWRVLSDTDDGDGPTFEYILIEPLKATCLPTFRIDRNYRQDPSSAGVEVMDLDDDSGALVGTFKTIPEAVAAIREAVRVTLTSQGLRAVPKGDSDPERVSAIMGDALREAIRRTGRRQGPPKPVA